MLVTDRAQIQRYYQALLDRQQCFTGIFYACVKTTSVFCIATCRARKPKLKNVEFYTTFKEALDQGYRPCKICKPTENAHEAPKEVLRAIEMVKRHEKEKISDFRLRESGISPESVRRWFKKNYGITFHAFQRMYRINVAFQELKTGRKTTDTAFGVGYESLSGFGYTYKKLLGSSPRKSITKNVILLSRAATPLGPVFVAGTDKGICLVEFVDRKMLEKEFSDLQRLLKGTIIAGENQHTEQVKTELREYFQGERMHFDVALHTPGTEFQNVVWEALLNITHGQTMTYRQLAEKIGNPKAIRAVASANGLNRIAIVVPCHRVIGSDGQLRGYGGGLERKQWLLDHESAHYA